MVGLFSWVKVILSWLTVIAINQFATFMMMTDVVPLYLRPTRNAYGILGGIPQSEFTSEVIQQKIAQSPILLNASYAVITNSTYDGLLYNTEYIKNLEGRKTTFDSAWFLYTNFHPIYRGK